MQTLDQLTSMIFKGLSHGSRSAAPGAARGVSIVKIKDLVADGIANVGQLDLVHPTKEPTDKVLRIGDVVISTVGEKQKLAVVGDEHAGCVPDAHLAVLRFTDATARRRVVEYLRSEHGRNARLDAHGGAAVRSMNLQALRSLTIP